MTDRNFEAARDAIAASSEESSIYIGCDSQRYKSKEGKRVAKYATVIILHNDSKHGGQIFREFETHADFGKKTESIHVRLMKEVELSVKAVEAIIDVIGDRHVEIHLDINPNVMYASSSVVNAAIGYVRGTTGYEPMVKPDAWAATHCGDHVVRNMN